MGVVKFCVAKRCITIKKIDKKTVIDDNDN